MLLADLDSFSMPIWLKGSPTHPSCGSSSEKWQTGDLEDQGVRTCSIDEDVWPVGDRH